MQTLRELIRTIRPNKANFDYCSSTHQINGTLLEDIERIAEEYAALRSRQLEKALEEIVSLYEEECAMVTFQKAIAIGRRKLDNYRNNLK